MALSNYERLKRWREKHPYQAKKKRDEYLERKKNLSGVVESGHEPSRVNADHGQASSADGRLHGLAVLDQQQSESNASPAQSSPNKDITAQLRESIKPENLKPADPIQITSKPKIFHNYITGQVITEAAWNQLEKKRLEEEEKGYELDKESQF